VRYPEDDEESIDGEEDADRSADECFESFDESLDLLGPR
jgi:hypothetical protein